MALEKKNIYIYIYLFICTIVRTTGTEWKLNCSSDDDDDDNDDDGDNNNTLMMTKWVIIFVDFIPLRYANFNLIVGSYCVYERRWSHVPRSRHIRSTSICCQQNVMTTYTYRRCYKNISLRGEWKVSIWRRATVPLIPNLGTRWRWVVNFTLRPLYPRERTRCLFSRKDVWDPELRSRGILEEIEKGSPTVTPFVYYPRLFCPEY